VKRRDPEPVQEQESEKRLSDRALRDAFRARLERRDES
jgi:hypothetical protein